MISMHPKTVNQLAKAERLLNFIELHLGETTSAAIETLSDPDWEKLKELAESEGVSCKDIPSETTRRMVASLAKIRRNIDNLDPFARFK